MKIERVFVLRFESGARLPWGVPEFMSEDEAADFLAYVQSELEDGGARYFEECCTGHRKRLGSVDDDDEPLGRNRAIALGFSARPSAQTQRLERVATGLLKMGQEFQAISARREAERRVEAARVQEGQQRQQSQRGHDRER